MKISVLGLGYIGLPTAAMLAKHGFEVVGVDLQTRVVNKVNKGLTHISEPGLDKLVKAGVKKNTLRATKKVEPSDIFILTVPTPLKKKTQPDLTYLKQAVQDICPILEKGNLIIIESTSPVGTTELLLKKMRKSRPDLIFPSERRNVPKSDISIVYSPERVLPGKIIKELVENDRIIGGVTPDCAKFAKSIYSKFVKGNCLITDSRTAELCKLVENSFRDVNIAFANELSIISKDLNIDVWELISLANLHPRVNILKPGPGVGGHCIAIDPWFIVHSSKAKSDLIRTAREVNDSKPQYVLKQINQLIKKNNLKIPDTTIACLGITFKPDVEDLRESPALHVAKELKKKVFKNQFVVEPNVNNLPEELISKNVSLVQLNKAIKESDIIVILVGHEEFKGLRKADLEDKHIVDTVGII